MQPIKICLILTHKCTFSNHTMVECAVGELLEYKVLKLFVCGFYLQHCFMKNPSYTSEYYGCIILWWVRNCSHIMENLPQKFRWGGLIQHIVFKEFPGVFYMMRITPFDLQHNKKIKCHHATFFLIYWALKYYMVAHGQVVTTSRQITEVKQRRARFVLGWVTAARVTPPAMCRGVGQASHIPLPLSTQQWWVPGRTSMLNCNDWL